MKYFPRKGRLLARLSNLLWRPRREPDFSRIVVFDFHMIGDMVMLIPFLRELRARFPGSAITLVAPPWAHPVHEGQDLYDRHVEFLAPWVKRRAFRVMLRETLALIRLLRRASFTTGIEIRGDVRQILLMALCRVPAIVGYSFTGGRRLLALEVPDDGQHRSILDHHRQILEAIARKRNQPLPRATSFLPAIVLTDEEKARVRAQHRADRPHLGIQPFASLPLKEWGGPWPALTQVLKVSYEITVFASEAEASRARQLFPGLPVRSLPLREFIVELSALDIFLGMDSGPAHLAAAAGTPTVVLFGPVVPEFSRPISRTPVRVVSLADVPCRPCDQRRCVHRTHQFCMSYGHMDVLRAIEEISRQAKR